MERLIGSYTKTPYKPYTKGKQGSDENNGNNEQFHHRSDISIENENYKSVIKLPLYETLIHVQEKE